MICATVISPPPPIPVIARNTINWITEVLNEDAREPMKKIARPV
jgi:hypothetical protein